MKKLVNFGEVKEVKRGREQVKGHPLAAPWQTPAAAG
jgi:hypothetical protein